MTERQVFNVNLNNTQDISMNLYYALTKIPKVADTEDSYFSDKHMMTNKELCGQVEGYLGAVCQSLHPESPVYISVNPTNKNGAKFTVKLLHSNKGYSGTVYAIARKSNIIKKIINIFSQGAKRLDLSGST